MPGNFGLMHSVYIKQLADYFEFSVVLSHFQSAKNSKPLTYQSSGDEQKILNVIF